jgi:hypothetical protein
MVAIGKWNLAMVALQCSRTHQAANPYSNRILAEKDFEFPGLDEYALAAVRKRTGGRGACSLIPGFPACE